MSLHQSVLHHCIHGVYTYTCKLTFVNVHVYVDTVVHCMQYRRALSVPVLRPQPISPSGNRKHTELEHSFTDYGQRLKVEKIITGHHPTSQRTTVSPKRDVRPALSSMNELQWNLDTTFLSVPNTLLVYFITPTFPSVPGISTVGKAIILRV